MEHNSKAWANEVLEKVRWKMDWVSDKNQNIIPYRTDPDGNYIDQVSVTDDLSSDNGINWWTNGFWGGLMWLLYQDTRDEKYCNYARKCEEKLKKCFDAYYGLHHDVGFMFQPTAVADYMLTKNSESRKIALHAASLLAGRFNPIGKYIRAWNDLDNQDTRGWAIIDSMFNISLLFWASRETKDPRFAQIATLHADTIQKNFVREDGSVCHIVEFDPFTGERMKSHAGQGYAHGSSWTRGQGWAVYGFANAYKNTGNETYLTTAKQVAHYCIANLREDGIIPVDFRQPAKPDYEDSCGACIIAGGLLEIAKYVPETEKTIYIRAAVKMLEAITDHRADFSKDSDAIVKNCTGAYHDSVHHFTMSYGDYFYIEALYKLAEVGDLIW